jgi:transposase
MQKSDNIEALAIKKLQKENDELQKEISYLKSELAQIKRMLFGAKKEKFITSDNGQLSLFDALEEKQEELKVEEEISYTREKSNKQNKPSRQILPAHLEREQIIINPDLDIEGCKKIGEEITEVLEYLPGKLFVKQFIRPKYVVLNQENEQSIAIADLPSLPIPKGIAGSSLLSHLIISKYIDHLPFHRQVKMFKRDKVELSESTINGWLASVCNLLEPLYDKLVAKTTECDYLMADETPMPVLTKDKPNSTHKGYQWVYYSPLTKTVCFDYHKSRSREGPIAFLKDFKGTLQSDGYIAYDYFENTHTLLACMAHARRKFFDAKENDKAKAEYALGVIQKLYTIERDIKEFDSDKRKEIRLEKSAPILEELENWMNKNILKVLPKSAIGKAISYTLKLWSRLKRYIDDGRYEIDNNLVENSIRPVALGRKNYMFAGSHEGAKRAAMMYSFLGTCKMNDINPSQWLNDVLNRISDHKANKLDQLLPQNWIK